MAHLRGDVDRLERVQRRATKKVLRGLFTRIDYGN